MKTLLYEDLRARIAALRADARPVVNPLLTVAEIGDSIAEQRQPIRLPTLAEYRRFRDDPETQWLFDEEGFCVAAVKRYSKKPNLLSTPPDTATTGQSSCDMCS
jgi:hypothetical protein